jgi:hypothetical protein
MKAKSAFLLAAIIVLVQVVRRPAQYVDESSEEAINSPANSHQKKLINAVGNLKHFLLFILANTMYIYIS